MTARTRDARDGKDAKEAPLYGGYAMRVVGQERKLLHLEAPDGRVCLMISLGENGASVELAAASLRVATTGDLELDCERLRVNARDRIDLVAGDEIATEADAQHHRARLGNVDVVANDDVSLIGERVRLNSPDGLDPRTRRLPEKSIHAPCDFGPPPASPGR